MQKALNTILVVSIIINLVFIYIVTVKCRQTPVNTQIYTEKIDSLQTEIDKIYTKRDSIIEIIDTIVIRLESNNKQYEENYNIIISNAVNEDYDFFLEYLDRNKARHDSINNF